MPHVHIVIVNWNSWRDTVECLESLLRLPENDFCVTVCDNGSTDNSITNLIEWLDGKADVPAAAEAVWSQLESFRHREPNFRVVSPSDDFDQTDPPLITVIDGQQNRGFAGGSNIGIRLALADPDCRFMWLLNNDTVVAPKALWSLRKLMDNETEVAVCGSTLLYYDSPEIVQALGVHFRLATANPSPLGHMRNLAELPSRAEIEAQLSYVIGASMLVRRSVFERTGGLSEDYFLYFEEIDLASRLSSDERQAWAPESFVYHKVSKSIGPRSGPRPSDTGLYYMLVNCLRFYRKHHFTLLPIAIARVTWEAFKAIRRGDWIGVRIAKLAVVDFVLGVRRTGVVGVGNPENSKLRRS